MTRFSEFLHVVFDPNTGAGGGGQPQGDQQPPTQPPPSDPAPQPQGDQQPQQGIESLPQWAQDELKKTRQEAASYRTRAKQVEDARNEERKRLARELGLAQDETDPQKLADELAKQRHENRQLRIDNALSGAIAKHGAKPLLTRALLLADGTLGALDPTQADFSAQLDAAVEKVIKENPELKSVASTAPTAPVSSAGNFTGGNTVKQLTKADLKNMSEDDITKALNDGRLNDVLAGRSPT